MKDKKYNKPGIIKNQKQNKIDSFNDSLESLVVDQAKRMIDLTLYTKALLSTVPVALIGADKNGLIRALIQNSESGKTILFEGAKCNINFSEKRLF